MRWSPTDNFMDLTPISNTTCFYQLEVQKKVYLRADDPPGEHISMQKQVLLAPKKHTLYTKVCSHLLKKKKNHIPSLKEHYITSTMLWHVTVNQLSHYYDIFSFGSP